MITRDFLGNQVSLLGFGCMRFPQQSDGDIDVAATKQLISRAMENGVNYYDTAYPYHGGTSEIVLCDILRNYPRSSYLLANKYPGHQIADTYDPADIFEDQLRKCGVDYFDFYLLHNVNEASVNVYLDPQWGILDYFLEQRRQGRIKHLGFSCHCSVELLSDFLDATGDAMEFCQIQLNWLDWTLQQGKEKVALLNERSIPIVVMEPVRGGRLCQLADDDDRLLHRMRPNDSTASWSFRFLQDIPGIATILSGMGSIDMLNDNLKTFASSNPLNAEERDALLAIAEGMKKSVPCTSCRYCTDSCPMRLDIPLMMNAYNDLAFHATVTVGLRLEQLPANQLPSACIACGKCTDMCPQNINIPKIMEMLSGKLDALPKWADISKQRAEEARKLREKES